MPTTRITIQFAGLSRNDHIDPFPTDAQPIADAGPLLSLCCLARLRHNGASALIYISARSDPIIHP